MSGTEIDQNTPLLVTLPARQWNSMIGLANEGLGALAALLNEVQRQCMQQSQQRPDEAESVPMTQRRNGPFAPAERGEQSSA